MYNGATGEQIPVSIFIGPVYGMRLKHMVEDKWQARGKGRKDSKTHQPTAGRGAQGGLKIGEMDRDAILGHATAAFFKEAFMERSDGTTMPLCVSCGMVPIYNPRIGLAVCSMCDGPLKYIGTDNVNTIELLPPLGRPKAKIVEVEIPYSTKLLVQEQEAFLNMSMRFITTNGVQCLRPLERIAEDVPEEQSNELEERVLPAPEPVPEVNVEAPLENMVSLQDLNKAIENAIAAHEAAKVENIVVEDVVEGEEQSDEMGDNPSSVVNITIPNPMMAMPQQQQMEGMAPPPTMPQIEGLAPQTMAPAAPIMAPAPAPTMVPVPIAPMQQIGGAFHVDNMPVVHAAGGNQIINIDTSTEAMQRDGIDIMGGGRPLRRRYNPPQVNVQLGPSMPPAPVSGGSSIVGHQGGSSMGVLTVTKLE
jgi:hypothetical protein